MGRVFFCKEPGSNPPEGAGPGTPQTAAIILLFLAREVQLFSSFRKVGGWWCLANITFCEGFAHEPRSTLVVKCCVGVVWDGGSRILVTNLCLDQGCALLEWWLLGVMKH